MPRRAGVRNKDFDEKRLALAQRLRARLARDDAKRPSYAELAAAAGVSLATLRHYFGDRDAAIAAVLELHGALGAPHLETMRRPSGVFARSVRDAADYVAAGLSQPLVAELHAAGLAEGIAHSRAGPAYLREVLEPMILALEDRLRAHIKAGEMRDVDVRTAALTLVSPLFVAHLHQHWLGGSSSRPLDQDRLRSDNVDAFVRAYSA